MGNFKFINVKKKYAIGHNNIELPFFEGDIVLRDNNSEELDNIYYLMIKNVQIRPYFYEKQYGLKNSGGALINSPDYHGDGFSNKQMYIVPCKKENGSYVPHMELGIQEVAYPIYIEPNNPQEIYEKHQNDFYLPSDGDNPNAFTIINHHTHDVDQTYDPNIDISNFENNNNIDFSALIRYIRAIKVDNINQGNGQENEQSINILSPYNYFMNMSHNYFRDISSNPQFTRLFDTTVEGVINYKVDRIRNAKELQEITSQFQKESKSPIYKVNINIRYPRLDPDKYQQEIENVDPNIKNNNIIVNTDKNHKINSIGFGDNVANDDKAHIDYTITPNDPPIVDTDWEDNIYTGIRQFSLACRFSPEVSADDNGYEFVGPDGALYKIGGFKGDNQYPEDQFIINELDKTLERYFNDNDEYELAGEHNDLSFRNMADDLTRSNINLEFVNYTE